mgnify:CR=1 FL=1
MLDWDKQAARHISKQILFWDVENVFRFFGRFLDPNPGILGGSGFDLSVMSDPDPGSVWSPRTKAGAGSG